MGCICESENRIIWSPGNNYPKLSLVAEGNFIFLKRCDLCNSLWVESLYEPFASFRYLVKWNYTENDWEYINVLSKSEILCYWHEQEIKKHWLELSIEDLEKIEVHRKRSYYRYNPIDSSSDKKIDIEMILWNKIVKDLEIIQ